MSCPPRIAAKTTVRKTQRRGVKLSDLILRFLGVAVTLLVCFSARQPIILQENIDNSERSPYTAIDLQSAIVAWNNGKIIWPHHTEIANL